MDSFVNSSVMANKPADALSDGAGDPPSSGLTSLPPEVPRLAFRCDGKLLVSLVDLEDLDLSSREVWIGLVATEAEASDIHERVNFDEAASPTVARIRASLKKAQNPPPRE